MSPALTNKRTLVLKDRSAMLKLAREFFYSRDVLEVDCPLLTEFAALDSNIDLIMTECGRFLHSSPEYGMKRLLTEGIGDIFQISHVFRKAEIGSRHNPEFTMAEWYRLNFTLDDLIEETIAFIQLFLGPLSFAKISYREAFINLAHFDPKFGSAKSLSAHLKKNHFEFEGMESSNYDTLLQFALSSWIEPAFNPEKLTALIYFPASQAALSEKCVIEDYQVSKRFEVFGKGIELANGYQELSHAKELEERFIQENSDRTKKGEKPLPYDIKFLKALKQGLPPCSGVAVGFDRLMMLRHNASHIKDVIPFSWDAA